MIIGAHSIIYSKNPEADRSFFRDILKMPHVDVGEGWLIFGLPPAEVAMHPSENNDEHEFYLMCDDIKGFMNEMSKQQIACSDVHMMGWGMLTQVTLPGGGQLGVYQPRHARPKNASPTARKAAAKKKSTAKPASRPKKTAKKKARKK
jgi:hypothetical protein